MSDINWKNKYMALKAKFMDSVDMAFRLGYEQGTQQAQQDAMLQQQQQEAEMMQQQAQDPGMGDGMEQEGEQPEEAAPDSAHPGGSELDQHISQLESMVQKGEVDMTSLLKALDSFKSLKKTAEFNREMKKSAEAIPAIAKALHKPQFKLGQQANHNLSVNQKQAVSMQEKIVNDIMKSWAEEEKNAGSNILGVLSAEGLVKKD